MDKEKGSGRRGFLFGMLAGVGVTSATILTARTVGLNEEVTDTGTDTGPILYKRTEEAERYYKTLYN